jgi:hypothetical protein
MKTWGTTGHGMDIVDHGSVEFMRWFRIDVFKWSVGVKRDLKTWNGS